MADNTAQNGTATIAADDIGSGVLVQRVKRSLGRDGAASDAATPYSYLAAASANQDSTVVKNAAGVLYALLLTNTNAAVRYVKVYDKATGPTSSDTPKLRIAVPGSTTGAGVAMPVTVGMDFAAGISFRITTGVADNDTGAVAANEVIVNGAYV